MWTLPSGKLEQGESVAAEAAVREALEEARTARPQEVAEVSGWGSMGIPELIPGGLSGPVQT